MKASLLLAAALLCGAGAARAAPVRDDGGLCRSFCDAEAGKCRKDAQWAAANEADPLVDFHGPRADRDDFSAQKYDQAVRAADKDRFTHSQRCGESRTACRQKCGAPSPVAAASAAH